jgi:SAM-dependent methyltransferase
MGPTGELELTAHQGANEAISRINEEINRDPSAPTEAPAPEPAPAVGQEAFDNQRFWNERYATNMALGSGIGSRGELLVRKAAMLQAIIDEVTPSSVLDVGCGDLAIVETLRLDGSYTGVDISDVVIQRNAERHPEWRFLHGEFASLARELDLTADLVICLDVLIHQHDSVAYREFVAALVGATRVTGVVAAYESAPPEQFASEITAFHGPITKLLSDLGARDVTVLDEYRATAVVRFAAPAPA